MENKLSGKVCLVTGGASGLGLATVTTLIEQNAKVAIFDLNKEKCKAVVDKYGKDKCIYTVGNICKEEDVKKALEQIKECFGKLDILVNNAGIWNGVQRTYDFGTDKAADMSWISKAIEVNLMGSINVLRLAVGLIGKNEPNKDGERGVVINTSSIHGMDTVPYQVGYVAAKGGLIAITPALAAEFADIGIRVNTIAPGPMKTPITENYDPSLKDQIRNLIKSGADITKALPNRCQFPARMGHPEEYAHAVQMIAENAMINGAVIRLDGMTHIHPQPGPPPTQAAAAGKPSKMQ